jgi:hypothetical protein
MRNLLVVFAIAAAGCAESQPATHFPGPPGAGGTIAGVVHQPNGLPLVGATIAVGQSTAVADQHGAFRLDQIAAGEHTLMVYFNEHVYELGNVRPGKELDLSVPLGLRHLDGDNVVPRPAVVSTVAQPLSLHGTDVGNVSSRR